MARGFVQPGETVTVIAPYAVSSGGGVLVGNLFGIALADAASGASVEIRRVGVWDVAKATGETWTQGALVYWNNTNKNLTTTVATNELVGVAMQAQAGADTVGRALLTGQVA